MCLENHFKLVLWMSSKWRVHAWSRPSATSISNWVELMIGDLVLHKSMFWRALALISALSTSTFEGTCHAMSGMAWMCAMIKKLLLLGSSTRGKCFGKNKWKNCQFHDIVHYKLSQIFITISLHYKRTIKAVWEKKLDF